MVADVKVARIARDPVLHRKKAVHHQRDFADALGEARMRRAATEPAFVDQLAASLHLAALAEPVARLLHERFRVVHMAIRHAPFAAQRKPQHRSELAPEGRALAKPSIRPEGVHPPRAESAEPTNPPPPPQK